MNICVVGAGAIGGLLGARLVHAGHEVSLIARGAHLATEPLRAARVYMNNYDTIVRLVSVTDTHRARKVAAQVFRSDDPIRWARRYLATLQRSDTSHTQDNS